MSGSPSPPQYRLVSINKVPERAKKLIAQLVEDVRDKYSIVHSANAETIESVAPLVSEHRPHLLFCASMWTRAESEQIQAIARKVIPDIRTFAVPYGMQAAKGSDAVVRHVEENLDKVIQGDRG